MQTPNLCDLFTVLFKREDVKEFQFFRMVERKVTILSDRKVLTIMKGGFRKEVGNWK